MDFHNAYYVCTPCVLSVHNFGDTYCCRIPRCPVFGERIKQQVDVHLTQTTVEIFFAGTRIASHLRLHGRPNQYSTVESHMPPDHQAYLQWNGERFIRWAEQIGQHTAAIVRIFLSAHKVEQQGYKSCMALLKLADRYAPHRRTVAYARPLRISRSPDLSCFWLQYESLASSCGTASS